MVSDVVQNVLDLTGIKPRQACPCLALNSAPFTQLLCSWQLLQEPGSVPLKLRLCEGMLACGTRPC